MRRWRSVAAVAALVAIASLAGCVPEQATPVASETATPTVTVATPSPTPTPTASETPASAAANIPASCDDLGTASSRDETVGRSHQPNDGAVLAMIAQGTDDRLSL